MDMNVIMYILLFGTVVYITLMEHADWFCSDLHGFTFTECKGEGLPYRGSTPSSSDSILTLLHKIDIGSKAENNSIKWRKAALLSVIIVLALFTLVCTPGSLPEWNIFYTGSFISFAVLYFMLNFYSYHYSSLPEKNIRDSVKLLKEKLHLI